MKTRPRPFRVSVGLAAMALVVAPWIFAAARPAALPRGAALPIATLGAICCGLVLGSLGEWIVHRYFMHTRRPYFFNVPYRLHHVGHHWHHYTPDRYLHDGPIKYHPISNPLEVCVTRSGRLFVASSHVLFYLMFGLVFLFVPLCLVTENLAFMSTFIFTVLGECFLFLRVHDVIHHPGARRMERTAWFQFLNRHHYIHHVDNGANTNFLLPLCDLLFGTLRLRLTAPEIARWGSFEEATSTRIPSDRRAEAA